MKIHDVDTSIQVFNLSSALDVQSNANTDYIN